MSHVRQGDVFVAVKDLECLADEGSVENAGRVEDVGRGGRWLLLAVTAARSGSVAVGRPMVERALHFDGDLGRRPQVAPHLIYSVVGKRKRDGQTRETLRIRRPSQHTRSGQDAGTAALSLV